MNKTRPVPISAGDHPAWKSVASSGAHTCAIRSDHSAWCWGGTGGYGSIGDGTTNDSLVPVPIGTDTHWRTISHGLGHHTCGLRFDHTAWCWGDNMFGQVGDGTRDDALSPVPVTS